MNTTSWAIGWIDLIGLAGTFIIVSAYFASQMRFINSSDLMFPILNLFGSLLLTLSLCFHFNLAALVLEVFWAAISVLGIWKCSLQRQKHEGEAQG